MPEELTMNPKTLEQLLAAPGASFHLVGVAGSGMSGLARLLLERGMRVSGSDLADASETEALAKLGAKIHQGHDATHVGEVDALVYSSAIAPNNPERAAAAAAGIPSFRRGELLAALARSKRAIVVAGMHGKTTTTAMLACILRAAGLEPSYYIGAEMATLGGSAHWGTGEWFVIESDESDGSFTLLEPEHAIFLNIEPEHLDHYPTLEEILTAFGQLARKTSGSVVYCADDSNAAAAAREGARQVSYGLREAADWRATDLAAENQGSRFCVEKGGKKIASGTLHVPGRHNVSNALGALALAQLVGIAPEQALAALEKFRGASRRFENKLVRGGVRIVDDYAHHPTEVRATLAAARALQPQRLLALFQPHRYTRTQALLPEFAGAFADADRVWVGEVYAASEAPIQGVGGEAVAQAIAASGHPRVEFVPTLDQLHQRASREIQPGDLALVMGAGDITGVADSLAQELDWFFELRERLKPASNLARQEPMAKHTTMRVGGPAQFWFEPIDEQDLAIGLRWAKAHALPVTPIGRGSNLIVREGGIRGLCVHLTGPFFNRVEVHEGKITAGAGARLKVVVAEARKHGIGGFEFMEGIPGNLGGALRMNAGAMQGWTMEVIASVRSMDRDGNVHEQPSSALEVHYRNVPHFHDHIALSAVLRGVAVPPEKIQEKLKAFSGKRWESQPAAPSAGCIFKNPGPIPAGKLIDELGLKNSAVGKARVSEVHGNFIVNDGGASARDVLALIEQIKAQARAQRGIALEMEAIVLGEDL